MASRLILRALLGCLIATPLAAAEIYWAEPVTNDFQYVYPATTIGDPIEAGDIKSFATALHLRIEGDIEPGDREKLDQLFSDKLTFPILDRPNEVVVSLNSDGGNFYEGLAIADAIAGQAVTTFVGPGDRCLSSCAIAFMGGAKMYLRGFPTWPSRYLHTDGLLGFHAPFSEIPSAIQIPNGTVLTDNLTRQIAQSFYGQAQAAINEIARRMSDWQISPDLVFGMLTKESYVGDLRPVKERFILVDSFDKVNQIKAELLTTKLEYPAEIGAADAISACFYLVRSNTGLFAQFGLPAEAESLVNNDVIAEGDRVARNDDGTWKFDPIPTVAGRFPDVVSKKIANLTTRRLVPGTDPEAYFATGILRGLGAVQCSAFRGDDGRWYARTYNTDVHHPENNGTSVRGRGAELVDVRVLDFEKAYPINRYIVLGAGGSWLFPPTFGATDLEWMPADILDIKGPSFNCSGDLDPAAKVVCEFPELSAADGRMGALYRAARKIRGDVILQQQRAWIHARDRVCRPGHVNLDDNFIRWNLASCLIDMTSARNRTLAEQLK